MAIYEFTISQTIAVEAEDEKQAEEAARHAILDLDWWAYNVEYNRELTTITELTDGWGGECLPWGGDGNTRLKDILPA